MADSYVVNYNSNPTITNLEHSDIEYVNMFSKKIVFYNPEVDEPLHKFWYYLPKVKIINTDKNNIRIVFSNKDKIMTSVNSLDDRVDEITKTIFGCDSIIAKSITIRPNYPPTMDLIYDAKTKLFDQMNRKIDTGELENGMNMMMYIEFDQIFITSNGFFRKWRIIQMKCLKNSISLTENLFEENLNSQQSNGLMNLNPIPPPPPLSPSNDHPSFSSKTSNNNFPQPMNETKKDKTVPVEFFAPTKDQLIDMMNRLKKKSDINTKISNQPNKQKDGLNQIMNELIKKKELMDNDRNKKMIRQYIEECSLLCKIDFDEMKIQIDTFNELCLSIDRTIANDQIIKHHINKEYTDDQTDDQTDDPTDDEDPFLLPYEGSRRLN